MDVSRLDDFVRGWFIGGFEPVLYKTTDVEVAVQTFQAGQSEAAHCHKIATEITVIVSGEARMNDRVVGPGDIVRLSPGEYCNFEALKDTVTAVIKIPGALNDKYMKA